MRVLKSFFPKLIAVTFLVLATVSLGADNKDKWVIFLYLCGSDLETESGAATEDISEILQAKLPSDVKIVIQTGGAKRWHKYGIKSNKLGRYVVTNRKLQLIENLPNASMGNKETLKSFMKFGLQNYPSEKKAFIIWNHGQGSAQGVAVDEIYDNHLSLLDINNALKELRNEKLNVYYDIFGFDACLMATLDTARALVSYAKYMVASQETEPGTGWMYTKFLNKIGQNPNISSLDVSKGIVDSYMDSIRHTEDEENVTLSVVDLDKIKALVFHYNNFGIEVAKMIHQDRSFLSTYNRVAQKSDNFTNIKGNFVSGMVDLSDLTKNLQAQGAKVNSSKVLDSLNSAVVYNKVGRLHKNAKGVSVFFPYEKGNLVSSLRRETGVDSFKLLNYATSNLIGKDEAKKKFLELINWLNSNENNMLTANNTASVDLMIPYSLNYTGGNQGSQGSSNTQYASNDSDEEDSDDGQSQTSGGLVAIGSSASDDEYADNDEGEYEADDDSSQGSSGLVAIGEPVSSYSTSIAQALGVSSTSNNDHEYENATSGIFNSIQDINDSIKVEDLEDKEVYVNEDKNFEVKLTEKEMDMLDEVSFQVFLYSTEDDVMLHLGSDANMNQDWDAGLFSIEFEGEWAAFDGHVIKMDLVHIGDEFFRYIVPLKVNGLRVDMTIIYDFDTERYHILSVKKHNTDGVVERNEIRLKPGDKITTVHLVSSLSSEGEDEKETDIETFTYTADSKIEDQDLGDSKYILLFQFTGLDGKTATSQALRVTVEGDYITNEVIGDDEGNE